MSEDELEIEEIDISSIPNRRHNDLLLGKLIAEVNAANRLIAAMEMENFQIKRDIAQLQADRNKAIGYMAAAAMAGGAIGDKAATFVAQLMGG